MAVKNGNDYLVWVATPAPTPSYAAVAGQSDVNLESIRQVIDASHKTSGTVALKLSGLRDVTLNFNFNTDLPDTGGYTVLETAHKSTTSRVLVQLRKGGATGAAPADVVFAAEMIVTSFNFSGPLNGVVSGSATLELAAVPLTDLVLA